jgi:hypothetical protein
MPENVFIVFFSLILLFQTIQYSYRFLALNIKAQTCSPCSILLCGKTVNKTRLELNAEVMLIIIVVVVVVVVIIIIIIIIIVNITVVPS